MSTKHNNSNTKTTIVIISKTGTLSECLVEPTEDTTLEKLTVLLAKKCSFRNHDGFSCYHTWRYKNKKKFAFLVSNETEPVIPKYMYIDVWAKTDGRAGNENKYELPPPIDELIIFGNIALVARIDKETAVDLTIELWNVIYEKLFGGFEDLAATAKEDEEEEDELLNVPKSKKTKIGGYLKDGFVVDDDGEESDNSEKDSDDYEDSESTIEIDEKDEQEGSDNIENVGSELSEESYDTDEKSQTDTDDDIEDI